METVVCDLCQSDNVQLVLRQRDLLLGVSDDEFSIVRCTTCGLLYLNPRPAPEEIGRYYPETYYPSAPPPKQKSVLERKAKECSVLIKRWIMEDFYGYPATGHRGVWRSLRKVLLWPEKARRCFVGRHIMPWVGQGRVLDVGCGTGGNLATLQGQGWEVYGIEISERGAAEARKRVGNGVHAGTLETAPFEEKLFDVVFMNHSLEHLFSPTDALHRVNQLLALNGMVVIAVPNVNSVEARLFGRWWFNWDPPRHLYHFERRTLTRLLERAGFRVLRWRSAVGTLFFMQSLERVWRWRFGGRLPASRLVEKLVAPICLLAGHLGYGTEITVYAVKAESELGRYR